MRKTTGFLTRNTTLVYSVVVICVLCLICLPYGKRIIDQIPEYKWNTSNIGEKESKEPFGAKYLDEYLHEYWKGKVYVTENVDSAIEEHKKKRANYLIISAPYYFVSTHTARIISMVDKGNNILLASPNEFAGIEENFSIDIQEKTWDERDFDIKDFLRNPDARKRTELFIMNNDNKKLERIRIWDNMFSATMASALGTDSDSKEADSSYSNIPQGTYTSLITICDQYRDLAALRKIGKGRITFCSSLAFFCNYGVKDEGLRKGMEHIMKNTFDRSLPLVIVYKGTQISEEGESTSAFMVLLEHPATALFLWLLVAALLLAIFINGRRRRRAEPIRKKSRNSSIDYIKHLATIYTNSTDYNELLKIEKRVLLYKFRKEYYFDTRTRNFSSISQFAEHVAVSKHLDAAKVRSILDTLEELSTTTGQVDAKSYRLCLEQLSILNNEE